MSNSQRTLAILVGLGLAFAMGITFDGLFGEAYVPGICPTQDVACATIMSAEATRTIAIWTRFDAFLSVFTGAAAIFAFLAYRAAREQADTAREDLEHQRTISLEVGRRETLRVRHEMARSRGRPKFLEVDIRAEVTSYGLEYSVVANVQNVGPSRMEDISGSIEITIFEGRSIVLNCNDDKMGFANPTRVAPGASQSFAFFTEVVAPPTPPTRRFRTFLVGCDITLGWRDTLGNKISSVSKFSAAVSNFTTFSTSAHEGRQLLTVSDGIETWEELLPD